MNPSDPDHRLSETLAAWRVAPPPNPQFRPAVWERLRRGQPETWAGYVRSRALGWSLAAGVALVAASWGGHSFAEARLAANREQMVVAYLGNLDPRVLANLRP